MDKLIWGLIKEVRPRQWIKNFAIFAGLLFYGYLDRVSYFQTTFKAFIIFSGIASAVYLLNDCLDIESDRLHPFKKLRPIASGLIPIPLALTLSALLVITFLPLSFTIAPLFFAACLAYLILQVSYCAFLKNVILLDVMTIATGFVLRVYAGVWAIDAHLNVWFLLTVTSVALFLAIGKRRSELTLLQSSAGAHRKTMLHYPENLLDIFTSMFANATWLTYAIFTFLQPPISVPQTTYINILNLITFPLVPAKYLMVTIPVVIYGVMRYLYIIYEKKQGESPERVLLTDRPLLISVVLWGTLVVTIIYYLGA